MTLHAIEPEPVAEGIIEVLEEVLESAKSGKVSSVAIAVVLRDGAPDWAMSYLPCVSTMLGTIDRMHFAIMQETVE